MSICKTHTLKLKRVCNFLSSYDPGGVGNIEVELTVVSLLSFGPCEVGIISNIVLLIFLKALVGSDPEILNRLEHRWVELLPEFHNFRMTLSKIKHREDHDKKHAEA